MTAWHFVARCAPPHRPLLVAPGAFWLWDLLRQLAPHALACVLMPNHLHLLVESEDPRGLRDRLARSLGQWSRWFGPPGFSWEPVPEPERVEDPTKKARSVRYVVLNPCRDGLSNDPLDWVFTTHRDVMGAIGDPWVTGAALRAQLGRGHSQAGALHRLHAWISADPSVDVAGTAPPKSARPVVVATSPLGDVAGAATAAVRGLPGDLRHLGPARPLFVQLAARHGWAAAAPLAAACGVSERSIRRLRGEPLSPGLIEAAELCLGDARLRSLNGVELPRPDIPSRPKRSRVRPVAPPARPRTVGRGALAWLERRRSRKG